MKFRNALLSGFPDESLPSVLPTLTERTVERGQVLFEPGDDVEQVFFPSNAILSVVTVMLNGQGVESSTVGHESAAPLLATLANEAVKTRVFCQIPGVGMSLPARTLRNAAAAHPVLGQLLLRHAAALAYMAEQSVACNALHEATQRLARWLLMTQDRMNSRSLPLTQDYMAVMTGVQRTTISAVAAQLKSEGLIRYSRGNLEVVDRKGLEARACECYALVRHEFRALVNEAS